MFKKKDNLKNTYGKNLPSFIYTTNWIVGPTS